LPARRWQSYLNLNLKLFMLFVLL